MAVYIEIFSDFGVLAGNPKVEDLKAVQNKLSNLLRCPKGSRFMQPLFGVRLWEFIHEPCDEITAYSIKQDFFQSIIDWVPEIQLDFPRCTVVPLPEGTGYYCDLPYTVPALQVAGSLSFNAWRNK